MVMLCTTANKADPNARKNSRGIYVSPRATTFKPRSEIMHARYAAKQNFSDSKSQDDGNDVCAIVGPVRAHIENHFVQKSTRTYMTTSMRA